MGTVATNYLPNATGLDLGSTGQRWDAFLQSLNVSGNSTLAGVSINSGSLIVLSGTGDPYGGSIQTAIAALPAGGGIIDATAVGVAAVNQGTIDPGSKTSVTILFGPYTYTVNQFILRSNEHIQGVSDITCCIIQAGDSSKDLFILGDSPFAVSGIHLSDMQFNGATANLSQRCFNFIASNNGGIWESRFERLFFQLFAGTVIDLQATNAGININQFLSFRDCTAYSIDPATVLNIQGDIGQLLFENCAFQVSYSALNTGTNIVIAQAGTSGFPIPTNIAFHMLTCQGAQTGIRVSGCQSVVVRDSHFELLQTGIVVSNGASFSSAGVTIDSCSFQNVGITGGTSVLNITASATNGFAAFTNNRIFNIGAGSYITGSTTGLTAFGNINAGAAGNALLGAYLSEKVIQYNSTPTGGNGLAPIVAVFDATAQTANVVSATLYTVPASRAGLYRVEATTMLTSVGTTSTLAQATVGWTDSDNNTGQVTGVTGSGLTGNSLNTLSSGTVIVNAKASTTILYATTGYASTGTPMQYAVHFRLSYLG